MYHMLKCGPLTKNYPKNSSNYWSQPEKKKKHSIATLRSDLKATFETSLVCAAVQRGKTMNREWWL